MSRRTLAIVAPAPKEPPAVQEIVLDEPRSDEAIVEIHAVGICHADVAVLQGVIPLGFPKVVGHEGAGVVKVVGTDVKHVQPGDKVILSFNPCGECGNCKRKLSSYCDHNMARTWPGLRPDQSFTLKSVDGKPIYGNFFGQSSWSRLALVQRDCMVKVPQDTDLKLFAPLGCGVQTGTGVVWNTLDLQKGDSFVVSGCGAVGMSAIMAAKQRGATTIMAVDINDERLSLAKELGATHTFNGGAEDLVQQIHAVSPLPAGVRNAFDTTAVPKVIEAMIQATGVRGRTVVVGATPPDKKISIQPMEFLNMGKQFIGSVEGDSHPPEAIPYMLEQHRQGHLPLEKIVSTYKYTEFARALDDMKTGKAIKPVLVWDDGDSAT
ncbi:hypothetical protein H2200_005794 [Cladophialophora chaetospira]|uniref:Enoyl reductase (ER) domain-containing protein n=1 Tax=Cladophialophora chaetospira TaxID=386627 RepID=A0AA38X9Q6_9EURO|nr:hypothetical protein H2200_005794 [Cladophialophora chaetospira]